MIRMFSSAHAYFMNSTVGEKQKPKSKRKSCLTQSVLDTFGIWYYTLTTQSLKAWT